MFNALDYASDQSDVLVKMPGGVADNCIKLAARPSVGGKVATGADISVAVNQIGSPSPWIKGNGPAIGEPSPRRVIVRIPEGPYRKPLDRARIFGWRLRDDSRRQRVLAVVLAPLDDIIVLNPVDCRFVPPTRPCQRTNIRNMNRCELGRELDHDPRAAFQLHHQKIVRIDLAPSAWRSGGDDPGGSGGSRWVSRPDQGQGEECCDTSHWQIEADSPLSGKRKLSSSFLHWEQ